MLKKVADGKIIIFTDLDGSLLHRETFKFDKIKKYLLKLIKKNIFIIPNSSKTRREIENFNKELKKNLTFVSENGSAIYGLNNFNKNLPNKTILSRNKDEIYNIFKKKVTGKLLSKCKFIFKMTIREQIEVLGLSKKMKEIALDREHSVPFIFNGNKSEKMKLNEIVKKSGLSIHEGGRMINLCDKVSKAEAMKKIIKICKKIEQKKLITIAVGDNFNDLEMLKSSNIPCLVFNDKFKKNKINIKDCLVSKKSSPEGWEEVVKLALEKINIKV